MACLGRCDVLCFVIAFLKFMWVFYSLPDARGGAQLKGILNVMA
jgi:hypothetical protein